MTLSDKARSRPCDYSALTGLLVLCLGSVGCGTHPPSSPGPVLTLTAVSPSSGATSGTRFVMLMGSGFRPGATVSFGGVTAVVTASGDTRMAVDTPAHAAGPVDVIVTNEDGQTATLTAAFTYALGGQAQDPPPSITGVSPPGGSTGGGAPVFISGTGFRAGTKVTFGGVPAPPGPPLSFLSEGSLFVSTPPHGIGPVTVVVTNPDGQSATLAAGYTYFAPGSFDFNGEWDAGTVFDSHTPVPFTIRNNVVVAASCAGVPIPLASPLPAVVDGEFSIVANGTTIMTGRIVTDTFATGRINIGPCGDFAWAARKLGP